MVAAKFRNVQASGLAAACRHLWQVHAPLTLSGLLMAGFTVFFALGIFLDGRMITGAPAWLKPAKFGISISVYTLTLTWMLGFVKGRRRLVELVAWTAILAFLVEMAAIVTQVVRGTTSHFNVATPFDTALYSVMGTAIVVLWLANLVLAALLLFQRFDNAAFAWSLRLAVLLTLLGMALGFLMTSPTEQQVAAWEAGAPVTIAGAHAVGARDGGPGLPVTGWSATGGDLRIPHFVGLHALQVLPLVGWLVARRRRWSARQQVALVWTAALGYLGVIGLFTQQALRGQSVIHPDLWTAGGFLGLLAATALSALVILHETPALRGAEAPVVPQGRS